VRVAALIFIGYDLLVFCFWLRMVRIKNAWQSVPSKMRDKFRWIAS